MPTTDSVLGDCLAFLHASPTPYHAVESAVARLAAAGFTRKDPRASWDDVVSGRYYAVQGDSTLIAWVVPASDAASSSARIDGFRILGAHTDSPNLRLKPRAYYTKEGYEQLGVEVYGGVLLNSWLDRDLSLAGRVIVRGGSADEDLSTRLISIARPLTRVPQLAIHFDREITDKGLLLNKQAHMPPVIGIAGETATSVLELCAIELGILPSAIVATDLMLFDVVPPTVAGARNEFVFSARLDNQAMCHAAVTSLIAAANQVDGRNLVPIIALFDHEEVGSSSAYGAGSSFLPRILERIALASGGTRDAYLRALAGSLCVSADMAHAVHPNYADRHDANHRPHINGGPVIKVNSQQRYATSATTAALFAELCREADVPAQHYVHRTDLACGSTIGPIVSTELAIRTVDVGNPMLSMHSIREMGGAKDPELMTRVLSRFLTCRDVFDGA
jgi:aspartyl aminopeptidase